jgi:hypothetical protein
MISKHSGRILREYENQLAHPHLRTQTGHKHEKEAGRGFIDQERLPSANFPFSQLAMTRLSLNLWTLTHVFCKILEQEVRSANPTCADCGAVLIGHR